LIGKTAAIYELVIDGIKAVAVQVNGIPLESELVISDYEMAILTAVAAKFRGRARGCYLHQSQVKINIYNYVSYKSMVESLSEY
jgi:3D (Asp-Asp-Asp) domain-containing protein